MQREIDAIFTDAICEPSKNGKPQVIFTFQVDNGRVRFFQSLNGGAFERTIEKLRAVGWTGNDPTDLRGIPPGKRVELVLEDREYEGKQKTDLVYVNEPGRRQARAVPADMAADLRARMAALPKAEADADFP